LAGTLTPGEPVLFFPSSASPRGFPLCMSWPEREEKPSEVDKVYTSRGRDVLRATGDCWRNREPAGADQASRQLRVSRHWGLPLTPSPRAIRYTCSVQERNLFMKSVWRAVIEVAFIMFLFYANLLMGEFERSGLGQKKGWASAVADVFTTANFEIAMIAALLGYVFFEFLRKKF
jgi:hypothetical protein